MKSICILISFSLFLLTVNQTRGGQMDSDTLIQFLNFSQTLIQDGELKLLLYRRFPTPPDEVGMERRKMMAGFESELRELPDDVPDYEVRRNRILKYIEEEKKYGGYRDADYNFQFSELNLTFQVRPGSGGVDYRLERIFPLEHLPSLALKRFRGVGGQDFFFSNRIQSLRIRPPNPLKNNRIMATIFKLNKQGEDWDMGFQDAVVDDTILIPSAHYIDIVEAQVSQSKLNGDEVTVITDVSPPVEGEVVKVLVYVRFVAGVPQVFREEFYYQSQSPRMDEDGFWLRSVYDYSDFEIVENLNIAVPKVKEMKEYRNVDGFVRFHSVITIKEMKFNVGFPAKFFDWNEAELTNDAGESVHIDVFKQVQENKGEK